MFFMQDFRSKNKGQNTSVSGIAKQAGEKWQNISETDKKLFQDMADKDKKRYESDLANGMVVASKKSKKKVVKKMKDPNAPKKAKTAYICFLTEFRKTNTNKGSKLISIGAAQWKEMSEQDKKKYVEMETKDKERFAAEFKKYESSGQLAKFEKLKQGAATSASKKSKGKVTKAQKKKAVEVQSVSTDEEDIESQSSDIDNEDSE